MKSDSRPSQKKPRVLFIIPGHQVEQDGISDYSFWLAAAAGRAGVDCLVFSLYPIDQENLSAYTSRFPLDTSGTLTVRQPTTQNLSNKLEELAHTLSEFQPHWVSLQFTPGTFRQGRFFFPSIRKLARLLAPHAPVRLTVHETGRILHPFAKGLHRWLAFLREKEISSGLVQIRPQKIFISNPQHHRELSRVGFNPGYLPIFSNIPLTDAVSPPAHPEIPSSARIGLFFGRIDPDWDPVPIISALSAEADQQDLPLVILSIGASGHRNRGWGNVSQAASSHGLPYHQLGILAPAEISAWLQHATYGLTSTPLHLWQKSSTCAAMIQHHLPIAFSGKPYDDKHPLPPRYGSIQSGRLVWTTPSSDRLSSHSTADEVWYQMSKS